METDDPDEAYLGSRRSAACHSIARMAGVGVLLIVIVASLGLALGFLLEDGGPNHRPINVAAFNIRTFGRTKMSNSVVAGYITRIVNLYDIILIQEVRDSSGSALNDLWHRLNATDSWGLESSHPIGRTTYKEQYVFFYRTKYVKVLGTYQYNDGSSDPYEREPFTVEIQYYSISKSATRRVVLLGLHTKPKDTVSELEHLPAVIKQVSSHFRHADGVISMGDFNADCNYLNNAEKNSMEIFKGGAFRSLIDHTADTTVAAGTDCAYDRIIVYGSAIDARNARVYQYESYLGIHSEDIADDVSDHYPVEFQLY